MRRLSYLGTLLFVFIGLIGASSALGQGPQRAPSGQVDVSDEQIQSVANVYVAVQDLREQYQEEYGNPQNLDSTKAAEVQQEFRQEMKQLLQEEDVTRQTFGQVMQSAQMNQQLRQKLFTAIEEAGGQPPQMRRRQQQGPAQAPDVSQEQVTAVAEAYAEIQQLRSQFQQDYGNPQEMDSTQAAKVQQKFRQQMSQTIQDSGVNPQVFTQVMQAIRMDQQLRQQFMSALKEAGGQMPSPQGGQAAPQR